jgi:hypothetical protein
VSFADDLSSMLDGPFAVSCTAGSTTANGILNEPTAMALGDQVVYTDYVLTCLASAFGNLVAGDSITCGGTAYTVRAVELGLDGLEAQISLSKT